MVFLRNLISSLRLKIVLVFHHYLYRRFSRVKLVLYGCTKGWLVANILRSFRPFSVVYFDVRFLLKRSCGNC